MKTTLYMAISADGFIATPDDKTSWSDASWSAFRAFVRTCDIVLLGRRTYEIMRDQNEFVDGPEYTVVTSNSSFDTGSYRKMNIKSKADLPQAANMGVIGGGQLNGSLATLGIFDEIILDVEPVMLGDGIRLLGSHNMKLELDLIDSEQLGLGVLHNCYRVIRNPFR